MMKHAKKVRKLTEETNTLVLHGSLFIMNVTKLASKLSNSKIRNITG